MTPGTGSAFNAFLPSWYVMTARLHVSFLSLWAQACLKLTVWRLALNWQSYSYMAMGCLLLHDLVLR
jgi:hypothetical protein